MCIIKTIDDFTEHVKNSLVLAFPYCKIENTTVSKNNGVRLAGITIHQQDSNVSPTIYLEKYFADFRGDRPITDIMQEIIRDCRATLDSIEMEMTADSIIDFAFARNKICYKLVNKELNREMLHNVPHRDFLDLAIVYYLQLSITDKGTSTVTITNSLARKFGIDEAHLYGLAQKNTPAIHRGCIMPMNDVLGNCLGVPSQPGRNCIPYDGFDFTVSRNHRLPMYVATSVNKIYGAGVILYDGLLDAVAGKIDSFYVLPSSVHEIIIVPDTFGDTKYITQMVRDINRSEVAPDEVLSDSCYHYSMERHTLEMVS